MRKRIRPITTRNATTTTIACRIGCIVPTQLKKAVTSLLSSTSVDSLES